MNYKPDKPIYLSHAVLADIVILCTVCQGADLQQLAHCALARLLTGKELLLGAVPRVHMYLVLYYTTRCARTLCLQIWLFFAQIARCAFQAILQYRET